MKVFFTPAINGEYVPQARLRMADRPDHEVYALVEDKLGPDNVDLLDKGYVKVISRNADGKVDGYYTYQQDDL